MLPKKYRLTKTKDIEEVVKKGRLLRGKFLSLHYLKLNTINSDKANSSLKIAISAGIKYSKRAVDRNLIRRRISAALEPLLQGKQTKEPAYVLFSVGRLNKDNYPDNFFAEISEEVKLLLNKAGIL